MSKMEERLNQHMAKSVEEKAKELREHKTNREYATHIRNQAEIERANTLDVTRVPENFYTELENQHDAMADSFKNRLPFITAQLTEFVPLYYPNLILVGALSGSGKTTVAANAIFRFYKNGFKTLLISNEELTIDVYNRIACLELGLNINKRELFTPEENSKIKSLHKTIGDSLRVIDIRYEDNPNLTSSVEGVEAILNSAFKNSGSFDCIIVDYYQKISISKNDPTKAKHLVLSELTNLLDRYYKLVKAPIIVLCQLHPTKKGETDSFESRIKEGKSIITACTYAIELKADKDMESTEWICRKGRFGNQGRQRETIWRNGKFFDRGGSQ